MSIDYISIGRRVRRERKKQNLTQQALAELSRQSTTNISHIERGKTKLSLPTLISIANALAVSADKLLCESVEETKYVLSDELAQLLSDCSTKEMRAIINIIQAIKSSFCILQDQNQES